VSNAIPYFGTQKEMDYPDRIRSSDDRSRPGRILKKQPMAAKVIEVQKGIFEIFLPLPMRPTIINVYLVDCGGGKWTLIDTGMNTDDSRKTLEEAFRSVGTRLEDLSVLIGTHHHIDHFGTSSVIQQRSGAKVYIHELEFQRLNRMLYFGTAGPAARPESRPFFVRHGFPIDQYAMEGMRPPWMGTNAYSPTTKPDKFIADGDQITVGSRTFEVVWTPGHSPGHNVIFLRNEKVMIVGDHLLPKITPHVGIYPDADGSNPLGDFIASQKKVQNFDVELVLPAHGAIYHDHRHRANQLIEHHRYREAEMLDLIKNRPQTAFEVASQVFGSEERPIFHVMAATFETLAHLEYSCREGRAQRKEKDGRIVYHSV
jgi:glyoxylase-like metal-dependent hydrolase (beta-lactamase superfamily II)